MLRILLAVTAVLIYGSLYPWQFHEGLGPNGPVEALLHSWSLSFTPYGLRDIALNIAIYIPFGAAAYLWLSSRALLLRTTVPVLLAAVLSTALELAQYYDGQRNTSLVDVATNIAGAGLGMLLATTVAKPRQSAGVIRIEQPGALLLIGCWAGSFLFPLIPDLSRAHLAAKLGGILSGGFSAVLLYALFTSWLVAARLLGAVLGDLVTGAAFPLLGLLLPMRLLVLGLTTNWTYWASYFIAWLVWTALLSSSRHRDATLGWLTVISIVLTGLSPFHFDSVPQRFEWVPFRALFSTQWEIGFATFLRKAFLYGSAVWLFRESGMRLRYAAFGVAIGLAALEAVQLYIHFHVAEITDPLLAILVAWLLHRLARARVKPSLRTVRNSAI